MPISSAALMAFSAVFSSAPPQSHPPIAQEPNVSGEISTSEFPSFLSFILSVQSTGKNLPRVTTIKQKKSTTRVSFFFFLQRGSWLTNTSRRSEDSHGRPSLDRKSTRLNSS